MYMTACLIIHKTLTNQNAETNVDTQVNSTAIPECFPGQINTQRLSKHHYNSFWFGKKDTVWNFRNSISENLPLFEILENILKLLWAIIFGVRII